MKPERIRKHGFSALSVVVLLYLAACSGPSAKKAGDTSSKLPPPDGEYFQEIGREAGIDFVHSIGSEHLTNIVESSCGGTAMLDYDKDGYIDIFVTSGTWIEGFSSGEKPANLPGNRLYRNLGNGTFADVTKEAKIDEIAFSMGATVGDFNNDGYPDIYLSNYGPNLLYRNNGNGTFTDVTKKAGVGGGNECSVGAVWVDYDNDSYLDLYVGNYLRFDPAYKYYYAPDGFPGPMAYDSETDWLFHNNGDGTFSEVAAAMGITDKDGRAMGVGAADYDSDGFVDIYVANDHTLNYLWHNEGGTKFTDRGIMSGTAFSQAGEATVSMSVDFSDFNDDGLLDMFLSDDTYCSLYENKGNGVFTDISNPAGIATAAAQFVGWTSTFLDYDNDGDDDLFKTNGALKHLYGQEDQLFDNAGGGRFEEISNNLGKYFHEEYVGRGAALGDYDNDGDIDIFIVNLNNRSMLLRNNKGNTNSWITLDLEGTASNRDAIYARIEITAGGKTQTEQKRSTTGYLSQNDSRIHFGLGSAKVVDKITIVWPSGQKQELINVNTNQVLKVTEPAK